MYGSVEESKIGYSQIAGAICLASNGLLWIPNVESLSSNQKQKLESCLFSYV